MASINTRTTAAGTSHRVQWRHGGRQHVRSFVSYGAADAWKLRLELLGHDEALALLRDAPPATNVPTVAEALATHIERLTGIEQGTRRRYASLARLHIEPHLGSLPVDLLSRERAAAWINTLTSKSKLSGKTIRNVHSLLSAAMATAVHDKHIPENLVKGMRLPTTHREDEMVFLDDVEVSRLVGLTPAHWQPLVGTLVATGMRFGEATALTVGDVDLGRGTLRIRQAWKHTAGDGHRLGVPKSFRARRTIALPHSLRPALSALMEDRSPGEWLFTNTQGGPVRHNTFHSHVWTPLVHEFAGDALTKTGKVGRRRHTWTNDGDGKRPRIHDLRHTFASLAARSLSMTALQRHMGHESIQTTGDVYGHLYQADRDAFASVVNVDVPVPVQIGA